MQRMGLLTMAFLSLCFVSFGPNHSLAANFDVTAFGAKGNGITDDSIAFDQAWKALCGDASPNPTLTIPAGQTFLLSPILFSGPCKFPKVHIRLLGTISGPTTIGGWKGCVGRAKDTWILFDSVNGLTIDGSGRFDGNGAAWWRKFSTIESCNRPTALAFNNCNGLQISGTTHLNSPARHMAVGSSQNVDIGNLHISAPEDSPNTDGINIGFSTHVRFHDSIIQTGDDCVAIVSGSSDVNVTGVQCGPGHGISIGGLGPNGNHDTVDHVNVINCNFTGTENGPRIKTWPGGSGFARSILFQQIHLTNVRFPVIIDQHYCGGRPCTGTSTSAVQVSDVTFSNIQGSSATKHGITLDCSEIAHCTGIRLDHVTITGPGVVGICNNVQGLSITATSPPVVCK